MFPDWGNCVKITPSTPLPGVSIVATALRSSWLYCAGWWSALGVVGPYWSQLQEATMICACVCWIRFGREVGQFEAFTNPKPSMVRVATVASPVALRAAVMPYEASCITESPRPMTRSGSAAVGAVVRWIGTWLANPAAPGPLWPLCEGGAAGGAGGAPPGGSATAGNVGTTMIAAVATPATG